VKFKLWLMKQLGKVLMNNIKDATDSPKDWENFWKDMESSENDDFEEVWEEMDEIEPLTPKKTK